MSMVAHMLLLIAGAGAGRSPLVPATSAAEFRAPDPFTMSARMRPNWVLPPYNVSVTDIHPYYAVVRWTRGESSVKTYVQVNYGAGWTSMYYPSGWDEDSLLLWNFLDRARTYDLRLWHVKSGGVLYSDTVTIYQAFDTPPAPMATYIYETGCYNYHTEEPEVAEHYFIWSVDDARALGWDWEIYADSNSSGPFLVATGAQGTTWANVGSWPLGGSLVVDFYIRYVRAGYPDGEYLLMANGAHHINSCDTEEPRHASKIASALIMPPGDWLRHALHH